MEQFNKFHAITNGLWLVGAMVEYVFHVMVHAASQCINVGCVASWVLGLSKSKHSLCLEDICVPYKWFLHGLIKHWLSWQTAHQSIDNGLTSTAYGSLFVNYNYYSFSLCSAFAVGVGMIPKPTLPRLRERRGWPCFCTIRSGCQIITENTTLGCANEKPRGCIGNVCTGSSWKGGRWCIADPWERSEIG
jgi:hypothetical protein